MRFTFTSFFLCQAYVVAALVVGGILSPLAYAAIPWAMLLVYLYLWFRPGRSYLNLPLYLFLALCLPLLFAPLVGTWVSPVFTLPVVPLVDHSLRQSVPSRGIAYGRDGCRPTALCLRLALSLAAVALIALALGSWGLLISCALMGTYLGVNAGVVFRRISKLPIQARVDSYRVVAGSPTRVPLKLTNRSGVAGRVLLKPLYPWLNIEPRQFVFDRSTQTVELSFTPPLAGPTTLLAEADFTDPRGLVRSVFRLELLRLFVIPRARYAEWLARRYLETSRAGGQEAVTAIGPVSQRPSRKGTEFYGLRSYQAGDSARAIDWKHSLKLRQMIVKEFLDTGVEGAILAVNLSVSNDEEKDKLAYSLITTALTLARESIPSALAAYSQEAVVMTTPLLEPRQALLEALNLTREVKVSLSPLRYLAVPDIDRLRGNIHRLRHSPNQPAVRLAELLDLEYGAFRKGAATSPATKALESTLTKVRRRANVVILSAYNHDAEALAFHRHSLRQRGNQVLKMQLGLGQPTPRVFSKSFAGAISS